MIRKRLKPFALAAMVSSCAAIPTTAFAYCIDHAILLCMSGGFPPGAVCSAAKAVMIQRITPFPITPPLQLWRCPIGVSAPAPYKQSIPQPINAVFTQASWAVENTLPQSVKLWLAQAEATDDPLAFTRELRIIYGSGYLQQSEQNALQWRTSIRICDGDSQNCSHSTVGTGYGQGENGMDNVPTPPGPSVTYHSDHFNRDVSIRRILRRGLKLLYWDFEGNPTVTEWIYY